MRLLMLRGGEVIHIQFTFWMVFVAKMGYGCMDVDLYSIPNDGLVYLGLI